MEKQTLRYALNKMYLQDLYDKELQSANEIERPELETNHTDRLEDSTQ